ncbi:MAG: carboxypeptidase-like regulatory domain-containing protein [Bacteroidia bacterium]
MTCLLLFFFLPSKILYAQDSASVSGFVLAQDSTPIEGVTVSVFGLAITPAYSDAQGHYLLKIPANKALQLVFSGLGYEEEKTTTIDLQKGRMIKINQQLFPSAKSNLKILEVTDERDRSTEMTRLDSKLISAMPSPSEDFNALLMTQPGVHTNNELSSQYSVRGGNYDENLVYVNDIEVYRPFLVRSGEQEGLSFINPDMVSSVLFSAGGFEAKYGDKMSSVLDVKYRRPRKFAGTASGSLLGGSLHLEGSSDNYRFTWIVGVRQKTTQYLLNSLDTKGDYKPSFTDVQTYLTYDLSDKWELDFLGNLSRNKYLTVPQSRQTSFGTINQALDLQVYFGGQEVDQFEAGTGAFSLIYHPNEKTNIKFIASAYKDIEDETYDILGQYYINQLETDLSKPTFGQVAYNLGVGSFLNHARDYLNATVFSLANKGTINYGKNQFLWGLTYKLENITDQLSEWNMIDSAGYSLPQTPANEITLQNVVKANNTILANQVEGYVENVWTKQLKDTSHITLTAGIRSNYLDLNHQNVVSPRATFAFKPHWKTDILFRASSGFYYQPPFLREMLDYSGNLNTNVKAQQSIHYVLGSDLNFKAWDRPFKFTAEAFYKALNDIDPYEIDDVHVHYFANNDAKGYVTGIDMKVSGEFVRTLQSWASLSIMQAREESPDYSYYTFYNSAGQQIIPGYTYNNIATDSVKHNPGYIPRPTDQLVTFSIFFQDYLPKFPDFKMHLGLIFGSALPFGPPDQMRYKDTLRMPPYRRVDIGFSYQILKEGRKLSPHNAFNHLKSIWLGLEVFNILDINNTISYTWITDVNGRQYAVPNYLTTREVNLRLVVGF